MTNKNLYDILGIKKESSKDEIKKAHRKKSMKHHPDQGGDAKEFGLITTAYKILIDDEKREKYDSGESLDSILTSYEQKEQQALSTLSSILMDLINAIENVETRDLKDGMSMVLAGKIIDLNNNLKSAKKTCEKYKKAAKRLKSKGKHNFLRQVLLNQEQLINKEIVRLKVLKENHELAAKLLEDVDYEFEKEVANHVPQFFFSTTSTWG